MADIQRLCTEIPGYASFDLIVHKNILTNSIYLFLVWIIDMNKKISEDKTAMEGESITKPLEDVLISKWISVLNKNNYY